MLRKLYVHNFKTLLNFTFEPKGLNLLIGRNNVGKTNLCQALQFLSLTTHARLTNACVLSAGTLQSFTNRYLKEATANFACRCELAIGDECHQFDYSLNIEFPQSFEAGGGPSVASESLHVSGGGHTNRQLFSRKGTRIWWPDETPAKEPPGVTIDMGGVMPDGGSTALTLLKGPGPASLLAWRFKCYLESWISYDLENSHLRSTTLTPPDRCLAPDGSNLASVVHALKMGDDKAYRELLGMVRILEPELDAINFLASPDPTQVFMVFQDAEGRRFLPQELSTGTLRFLALASIPAKARQSTQSGEPTGLAVIEEPETGIFVGHLKPLLESIDPSGREGQYIFTSHSPYFIDLFDAHLDGVFLLKREKTHTTLVQPDPQRVRRLIEEEFSLGELHFREILETPK